MTLLQHVKSARRVSTPLLTISTPDPAATIRLLCDGLNGESPKVMWDCVRGFSPQNAQGKTAIEEMLNEGDDITKFQPVACAEAAAKLPANGILFIHAAHKWLNDPGFVQAVWNLRDLFKQDRRTLILLGPTLDLPPEISGDVVSFDEPLPDAEQIQEIIKNVNAEAHAEDGKEDGKEKESGIDQDVLARASSAVQGLPAFQVEQVTAMCLTANGLDVDQMWEHKRQQIEQMPGLSVWRGKESFSDIGGVVEVKQYLSRLIKGRSRPEAIIWLDEIEKAMAGSKSDSSGVSQDMLGTLLAYLEDHRCFGVVLLGAPGVAKSMIAKSAGNEVGIPTIRLDMGGLKASLVGQSETQMRNALKVITAVSNDKSLWIATANSISGLDTALRRRFNDVFFFDLPDASEKTLIWEIWKKKYDITDDVNFSDDGWVGANIQKACEKAYRLDCPLAEAAEYVVPVGKSAFAEINELRRQAEGCFLSASHPGTYVDPKNKAGKRQIKL